MSTTINLPSSSLPYSKSKNRMTKKTVAIVGASLTVTITAAVVLTVIIWPDPSQRPISIKPTTTTTTLKPPTKRPAWESSKYNNSMCRMQNCGQTGPNYFEDRIVGGRYATMDEFPHQVAIITKDGEVNCGGSMINDRWIISAARCVYINSTSLEDPRDIRVSVGIRDVKEIPFNEIEVEKFVVHPLFRYRYSHDHDIVLIKTQSSIGVSSANFVSPICLPFGDLDEDATVAKASGFGAIEEWGVKPSKLMMTTMQIVSDDHCEDIYAIYDKYNATLMICAGGPNLVGGEGICHGDSGGPLAIRNKNGSYVMKGITSYSTGCARKDIPSVFTRVSHYLEWICETMIENGLAD